MTNQQVWVQCWRCGNQRAAGPSWCPTCQAPEWATPGRHQTFRGPLVVPFPPVVPIVKTPEQKRRKRGTLLILGVAAVLLVGGIGVAGALRGPEDGQSPNHSTRGMVTACLDGRVLGDTVAIAAPAGRAFQAAVLKADLDAPMPLSVRQAAAVLADDAIHDVAAAQEDGRALLGTCSQFGWRP